MMVVWRASVISDDSQLAPREFASAECALRRTNRAGTWKARRRTRAKGVPEAEMKTIQGQSRQKIGVQE